jgi:hypothetical protein
MLLMLLKPRLLKARLRESRLRKSMPLGIGALNLVALQNAASGGDSA